MKERGPLSDARSAHTGGVGFVAASLSSPSSHTMNLRSSVMPAASSRSLASPHSSSRRGNASSFFSLMNFSCGREVSDASSAAIR